MTEVENVQPSDDGSKGQAAKASPAEKRWQATQAGRARKTEYLKNKSVVLEKEKENYKSLYLVRDQNGFYKMFSHSALIYAYEICPRLKRKCELKPDTDYDYTSKEGVVSIRNLEKIKEDLKGIKIYPRFEKQPIVIFELGYKVTDAELNKYRETEAIEWEKVNQIVYPKEIFAEFRVRLRALAKALYDTVHKMDGEARNAIGTEVDQRAAGVLSDLVLASNGWGKYAGDDSAKKYLDEAEDALYFIQSRLMSMSDLRLIDRKQAFNLASELDKAKVALKQERLHHGENNGKRNAKARK